MSLHFTPIEIASQTHSFSGTFIAQNSYADLLALVDAHFDLGMRSPNRKLPCVQSAYLLISKDPRKLWAHVGRSVSLNVESLIYNARHGFVVALVQLRQNFTCNQIPHIVLAKREGLSRATIKSVLETGVTDQSAYVSLKVHGRIGAMIGSAEEAQRSADVAFRPEITHSVENPLPESPPPMPTPASMPASTPGPTSVPSRTSNEPRSDDLEITLNKSSDPSGGVKGATATGEMHKGCPVYKGPRGGKYIIKDGHKVYVKGTVASTGTGTDKADRAGQSATGPVYKVSILE